MTVQFDSDEPRATSVRAGGIDWIARWREMREATERVNAAAGVVARDDPWEKRAARIDRISRTRGSIDASVDVLHGLVRLSDVVMDIGAGTGRHVVSLAPRVARVIAVEPSAAMRERLVERAREVSLTNVEIVASRWPISPPIEADVVLSAHVLYVVDDVESFLVAMHRAARRACALVLGLRAPIDLLGPLWARMRGCERPPRPAALEALAVLHQLGIRASLEPIAGSTRPFAFRPDDDEDLDELCDRVGLERSPADRARVREAMLALGTPGDDGAIVLATSGPHALIRWDTSS